MMMEDPKGKKIKSLLRLFSTLNLFSGCRSPWSGVGRYQVKRVPAVAVLHIVDHTYDGRDQVKEA
jgi:hypothetical protein